MFTFGFIEVDTMKAILIFAQKRFIIFQRVLI